MNDTEKRTYDRLIDKSQEAFLLAIELYNRPTIRYHAEGCSFFLCNAWELMLKAYLIKEHGEGSVYYPKKSRTLSLEDCLKKVFTNENDPVRRCLSVVNELRNTSTHFVTEEYELFYGPMLQAAVSFYDQKLSELHGIEISDRIPENYLMLSVRVAPLDEDAIRARYSDREIAKMLQAGSDVLGSTADGSIIPAYRTELRITKKKDADFSVRVTKDADAAVSILNRLINPKAKYVFGAKKATEQIQRKLSAADVTPWMGGAEREKFNVFHFGVFVDFYDMKGDERYSYNFAADDDPPLYRYSQQAIDLIVQEMKRDPMHVLDGMRSELKKRSEKKMGRPQEQGNSQHQ